MYPFEGKEGHIPFLDAIMMHSVFSDNGSIQYSVVTSSKAQRVVIRVDVRKGVVVVIPDGFDSDRVPGIVEARRAWIGKVVARLTPRMEQIAAEPDLPESLHLRAVGRVVRLTYHASARPFSVRSASGFPALSAADSEELGFFGRYDADRVRTYLRQWLVRQAKAHLPKLLTDLAGEHGVVVRSVQIRLQKSRWGSCSARRGINLNARLMFLPDPLVRYVCLHELAHCAHLNHSPAFWEHLEYLLPGAGAQDAALRQAWQYTPQWSYA